MLSLESPTVKMYRLASTSVNGERYLSLDEMLATVAALTADDMASAASEFFQPERQTIVSLGPTSQTPRRHDAKGGT
jgi:predicted Zn-dependent peptidase